MATRFSIVHGGNVGSLRIRFEDLKEVTGKDGKKVKQWVLSSNVGTVPPHEQHDAYVGANARRVVIEEVPT
jgi:hypothetical protein